MLAPLFGTENSERVLIFLLTRNEGYAREIAQFFGTNLYAIQRQLDKLEAGGVLVSRTQDERACISLIHVTLSLLS